jgi:hypothetical protein
LKDAGWALVLLGATVLVAGALLLVADRVPGIGKLPGDFVFRRGGVTIYFPLATFLLVSILLTIVLNLLRR